MSRRSRRSNRQIGRLAAIVGVFLLLPSPAPGQAGAARTPEAFARTLVAAINSRSVDRRLALLHAKSRACVNHQTQPYFESVLLRQTRHVIPSDYKTRVVPLRPAEAPASDGRSPLPVKPTHQLQIDFETGPYNSTTLVVLVAADRDGWGQVLGCPSAETVGLTLRADVEREKQEKRAQQLALQISAPLRVEIETLVKSGKRVAAINRYAEASGEDLATARRVVEIVAAR
jgi:hypothetical protein